MWAQAACPQRKNDRGTVVARARWASWEHDGCHSRGWALTRYRIGGNCKQFTGKVKEQWGKLTEHAITVIVGKQEQLVGRIQGPTASPG